VGAPLVVVGLDGATLDLVAPWAADGTLPNLARLMGRGGFGRLRSTMPPATFPAWTSLATGVNPGRHGVLDFTERVPGTYRVRFVNGGRRRAAALWTRYTAAGLRSVVLTVPGTYPPEPVRGIMVSGWDSPLTTGIDGSFVHPRGFHATLARVVGGRLPFADFQEIQAGAGWHARALTSLLDGVARRARLVRHCLEHERPDLLMVVFGESDTVAHHFWRFCDPRSPRFAPSGFGDAIQRVYAALDAALGEVVAAAPPEATIAVVSDHGSGGASDVVVQLNRRLHECGLLAFGAGVPRWSRRLRGAALTAVPVRWQGALLRRLPAASGAVESSIRFGGIAWDGTRAYSEELDYHPSVWLNVAGREPAGTVSGADYRAVRDRVVAALESWRHADGHPVVERVWRREEALHGPETERAPDLLLELALVQGYSPSCLRSDGPGPSIRRLRREEHGAGKGAGMNGAHRREGMIVLAGAGIRPIGDLGTCDVVDVVPTLLAAAGRAVPRGLDGVPRAHALLAPPRFEPDDVDPPAPGDVASDPAADAELAARLAALGYVEAAR
jgi:predicted AlkP superfamily phosphohydrolase/phosphomutase